MKIIEKVKDQYKFTKNAQEVIINILLVVDILLVLGFLTGILKVHI